MRKHEASAAPALADAVDKHTGLDLQEYTGLDLQELTRLATLSAGPAPPGRQKARAWLRRHDLHEWIAGKT